MPTKAVRHKTSRTRQRTAAPLTDYFSHVKPSVIHKSISRDYSNSACSQNTSHITSCAIHSSASGISPPCVTQTVSLRFTSNGAQLTLCWSCHFGAAASSEKISLYSTRRYEYKRTRNHDSTRSYISYERQTAHQCCQSRLSPVNHVFLKRRLIK